MRGEIVPTRAPGDLPSLRRFVVEAEALVARVEVDSRQVLDARLAERLHEPERFAQLTSGLLVLLPQRVGNLRAAEERQLPELGMVHVRKAPCGEGPDEIQRHRG